MPGFLGGSSGSGTGGEIRFPAEFIDPVTKLRVSEPQTLIDTDFEYGLQPTKWESVELINNTPSFFSKGGDTTIPNIASVTTTELSREIKVTTSLAHGLAVGIPINVSGTKSLTADGAYIINSVPDSFTFTYLCRQNQPESASIEDLYTSIVTGEFFQGSQIKIADSDGLVTNGAGNSVLTVTTESPHGFGINTPFYFLNLNSTISQEFDSSNTNSKAFDSSNSSTAQTFDGSNSLISYAVDLDNTAVLTGVVSSVSTVSLVNNTITVSHTSENFVGKPVGTPLYHNVSSASGYFSTTPRGVVFLKSLPTSTVNGSIFTVSLTPDGDVLPITSSVTGTFQLANAARTFAGNNLDATTQTTISLTREAAIEFDGGNQGYAGFQTNGLSEVLGYTGTTSPFLINTTTNAGLDYYVGAMVKYSTTGTAATGLTNDRTYFISSFATTSTVDQYRITIKEFPDSATVLSPTGGTGTQTFTKIGVSTDKDIIHIRSANYAVRDMLEYAFPVGGRFTTAETAKLFYFVSKAYDAHNYELTEVVETFPAATGGVTSDITVKGANYRVHTFPTVGTTNFVVTSGGLMEYLIVGGGGGGGTRHGGGGGAGGMVTGTVTTTPQTYPIVVGAAGLGRLHVQSGTKGGNSSAFGVTALGGGAGTRNVADTTGGQTDLNGGSGGGISDAGAPAGLGQQPGSASGGFGNAGGLGQGAPWYGGGGGGAGAAGENNVANVRGGHGGIGRLSTITGAAVYYAGGGGGSSWQGNVSNISGSGGFGGGGRAAINDATPAAAPANLGGGGGAHGGEAAGSGGNGGSGVVIVRYATTAVLPVATAATGGVATTTVVGDTTYRVHTFANVGTTNLVVSTAGNLGPIEYLIVAGGGGGGCGNPNEGGGGGGAGGLLFGSIPSLNVQTYSVVVGGGGSAATTSAANAGDGGSSSVFGVTAVGGGGGGSCSTPAGNPGGSGGGGGGCGAGKGGGNGTAGQGNPGGIGQWTGDASNPANGNNGNGGGGGGALAAGHSGFSRNGFNTGTGSIGGAGTGLTLNVNGTSTTYATGGNGGAGRSSHTGADAAANTGNGGGGSAGSELRGGNGGSGIVIIRYPIAIAGL